ncbi:MAG: 2-C-methyl-D-erythritol 2,4-cyclodiphosphate synthase [Myxococcota bacterium]|nr:2-C-methyl-D-erythritol 2,4-cyclodiphosphate synthase [Myxococcota bacterium]
MSGVRIGQGVDFHRLVADRPLWLGGVELPFDRGLAGHSDGDVLLHAVADAILGALGLGDLGAHFPSSDESLRDVASAELLARVVARMAAAGYRLGNLDATILAQVPRLSPHQPAMRKRLAEILGADEAAVNLKVTSTDGLGAIGRQEGIGAQAVVLLIPQEGDGLA